MYCINKVGKVMFSALQKFNFRYDFLFMLLISK